MHKPNACSLQTGQFQPVYLCNPRLSAKVIPWAKGIQRKNKIKQLWNCHFVLVWSAFLFVCLFFNYPQQTLALVYPRKCCHNQVDTLDTFPDCWFPSWSWAHSRLSPVCTEISADLSTSFRQPPPQDRSVLQYLPSGKSRLLTDFFVQCMAKMALLFLLFNQTQICNTRTPSHSLHILLPSLSMTVEVLAPPHCVDDL